MSLEQANAVEASSDLSAGNPNAESNDLETRFAGILDLDSSPAPEADKPIEGAEDAADQPEDPELEATVEGEEEAEADPWAGYEDFEFDGKSYKIPTELKDGYLRQADYSRKTAETAERARQVEAKEQELERRSVRSQEEFAASVELHQVTQALQQFKDIDWANEFQSKLNDPLAYQELHSRKVVFDQLRERYQQVAGYLNNVSAEREAQAQQDTAKRLEATRNFAMKEIKGWTPDLDGKITEFAMKDLGFSRDTLLNAYSPEIYKTLHLAYLGKQTLERQQTAKPSQTASKAKTTTLSAKSNPPAQKDPADMSEDEFFAYREAQIARRK